ncbi:MAG: AbrB/MazE/SpoVT family DNA-binding domain-containing protein [Burkholderiales bacterium]
MIKSIARIGNSQGLIFDSALLELAGLKAGDQVNIAVHEGGTITLTPIRRTASPEAVTATIRKTVKDYRRTLRRLA